MNPFAMWTAFVLKTGEMMLASMRAPATKLRDRPRVAVIPATEPTPPRKKASPPARKKARPKVKAKAKAKRARKRR